MKRSSYYQQIRGRLGVSRLRDDHDLASLVQQRLPATAIRSLLSSGLSDAEVYSLIVPRRTLAHRLTNRQPLSTEESDRAVRVARITAFAEHTFGEPVRAWRWMRKPKRQFDGKTAMEMLATEAGGRLVEELIAQVEHGMAA